MYRSTVVLLFHVFLFSTVQGRNLTLPSTVQACQPATVSWSTPPNASDSEDPSSIFFAISSKLSNGIQFTAVFTNLSIEGLSFIPIFDPGSTLLFFEPSYSAPPLQIQDSGQNDCILDISITSAPVAGGNSPIEKLAFVGSQSPTISLPQCESLPLAWTGGLPPYTIMVFNHPQSESTLGLQVVNITSTSINVTWPLQSNPNVEYELNLVDSSPNLQHVSIPMSIRDNEFAPIKSNCLVETTGTSPTTSASPEATPTSESSSSSSHGKTIIAIVVPIVVAAALILALFGIRQFRRKRLLHKTQEFKSRLDANAMRRDNLASLAKESQI